MSTQPVPSFAELGLAEPLVRAVNETGYELPTPIQAAAIPPLLAGRDLLGQAQTGTGKTAAFALPLLSRLDLAQRLPQLLVLTPTRELAIQVAEAMQTYARHLPGFHVLPIYGGQGMDTQLRALKRVVHAVVGTPGRVADHLRRGTLRLNGLTTVVLDEADEMLRMGFIEEVTGILEQTPANKQVALFSATMPPAISRIARSHLRDPAEIRIASKTTTVATVSQHYWEVSGAHKLDALTRILEVEDFDAMLVFVRTRNTTVELSERLEARGYGSAALNGDMPQTLRERTIDKLKSGAIDILVATDVAARGLDVERISHVINYDVPHDAEAYVHRIGRTGRAGRSGSAVLFVAPRERRMLRAIEHSTGQPIIHMRMPSSEDISDRRTARFKQLITDTIAGQDLTFLATVIEGYQSEHNVSAADIAAALAWHVQREKPLRPAGSSAAAGPRKRNLPARTVEPRTPMAIAEAGTAPAAPRPRPEKKVRPPRQNAPVIVEDSAAASAAGLLVGRLAGSGAAHGASGETPELESSVAEKPRRQGVKPTTEPLLRYRIAVGRAHGAEPRHIVGAIANESGLDSEFIGRVHIEDTHSTVELPEGMPKVIFKHLKKVWVCGQQLDIEPDTSAGADPRPPRPASTDSRPGVAGRDRRGEGKRPPSAGFDKKRSTATKGPTSDTGRPAGEHAWPADPSRSGGKRAGHGNLSSTSGEQAGPAGDAAFPPASEQTSPASYRDRPGGSGKPGGFAGKARPGGKPAPHRGKPGGKGGTGPGGKPGAYRDKAGATARPTGPGGKPAPYRGKPGTAGKPGPGGASATYRGSKSGATDKPGGFAGKPGPGGKSAPYRGKSSATGKPGTGGKSVPYFGKSPAGGKPATAGGKPGAGGKSAPYYGKSPAARKSAARSGKPTLTTRGASARPADKPGAPGDADRGKPRPTDDD